MVLKTQKHLLMRLVTIKLTLNRMKKYTYTVFFSLFFFNFLGQNVSFERDNFPGRKDEFREAVKKLDAGTQFYTLGRKEFDDTKRYYLTDHKYFPVSHYDYQKAGLKNFKLALPLLADAYRFNPNNANLNYMLGFACFIIDPLTKETITYFEAANNSDPNVETDLCYWLGWIYHLNSRWDDAITQYKKYLSYLQQKNKSNIAGLEDVNKKIAECTVGKQLSTTPERVFVDNLGPNINSPYPDYGPSISTDEETIFFTARRPNSVGGKKTDYDNGFYEDIYSSYKINGSWQMAKQLSKNVNTDTHDAAAGLSADGSKLFIYRNSGMDGGDLYESVLFGKDWEVPEHMNKNINTKFHESTVSLSFDGKRMYFISDKLSGFGDRDIYFSDMDLKGEWGSARNLGADINTKYSEEAVFMHPDGTTLYFSSKGHNSMGGYDIFKTSFVNGKWKTPENMGYPINGPDDDVFFVVSGSGNRAYFASAKQGGFGEKDIYKITFLGPEKEPLLNTEDQLLAMVANPVSNLKTESELVVKSAKLTLLKGLIKDAKSNEPLEASIELIDNDKNITVSTFKSNSNSGKYLVALPSGKNYGISVKREGYLFHSENFNLPEDASFQEFNQDVGLKKIEIGSTIVLRNIFFDSDKATIRNESINELERLIKLLTDNPSIKIELASHTDADGSAEYNLKLSNSRSVSVVDYLISKNISSSRLIAKGYGESKAIATNDTEEGKQKNRRTEFKILEK
jgi:outer membrane protein OmpA-like peptidoglycan-associated protein/tetratricopeptide (TPR) repeat protein